MKKGQALVEFVLILPVFVLILFTIIDFGRILGVKNEMQGLTNDVVRLYKNNKSYEEIMEFLNKNNEDITLSINNTEGSYTTITLENKVNVVTPGLDLIISDPYVITVNEVFPNE